MERLVHPAELRLGLQANFPWYQAVSVGATWQLLLNDAGDGGLRSTFLHTPDGKGDINFSELVDPRRAAEVGEFLSRQDATFSENSSRVFSTNNPDFDGWRNIPVDPRRIVAQGRGNVVVFITWHIK